MINVCLPCVGGWQSTEAEFLKDNRDLLLNSQSLLKKNCELNCEFANSQFKIANSQFKIANSQFKIANWPKTLRIKLRICELDSQFGGRFRLRMVEPHTFMGWGISFERFLRFVDFVLFCLNRF